MVTQAGMYKIAMIFILISTTVDAIEDAGKKIRAKTVFIDGPVDMSPIMPPVRLTVDQESSLQELFKSWAVVKNNDENISRNLNESQVQTYPAGDIDSKTIHKNRKNSKRKPKKNDLSLKKLRLNPYGNPIKEGSDAEQMTICKEFPYSQAALKGLKCLIEEFAHSKSRI